MALTNSSSGNELSTPLLGNRSQPHENDEEQGYIPCPSLAQAIGHNDDDNDEVSCQKSDEDDRQWIKTFISFLYDSLWGKNLASLAILPALLFLQFGVTFSMSPVQDTTGLKLSLVNYSIVILVITVALYRRALDECQITCMVATLLPEILMDTVLGLVLCDQVVPAFMLLQSSTLFLAVLALLLLLCNNHSQHEKSEEEQRCGMHPVPLTGAGKQQASNIC
jgi:hypothetical protein